MAASSGVTSSSGGDGVTPSATSPVNIANANANGPAASAPPHGASATSRSTSTTTTTSSSRQHHQHTQSASAGTTLLSGQSGSGNGSRTRLSRGNSFRIPLPPSGTGTTGGGGGAVSPNSPGTGGGQQQYQLGTSYGSATSNSGGGGGGRLANLVGFRRNRGASTNRGELTSPTINTVNSSSYSNQQSQYPPQPSPPAFSPLQTSTSLTEFGGPASPDVAADMEGTGGGGGGHGYASQGLSSSVGQQTPGGSASGSGGGGLSSTRGYFTRRGFGRKNTGSGLLSGGGASSTSNTGSRTPTSENGPLPQVTGGTASSSSAAMARSRSSSQPSLPLNHPASAAAAAAAATQNPPNSANAIVSGGGAGTGAGAGGLSSSVSGPIFSLSATASSQQDTATSTLQPSSAAAAGASGGSSSSSRRPSGEAVRTNTTDRAAASASASTSSSMHRRNTSQAQHATAGTSTSTSTGNAAAATSSSSSSSSDAQHIRLVPHLESTRSLHFDPVSRDVPPTIPLRIGRFTDRNPNQPISSLDQNRVAFKSKVVSRTHAEIWFDPTPVAAGTGSANGGGWFIRDLKSSSGTFLNHIRLSGAGMESRPFPIRDGDVLQLGVDYQGGTEEIYRCVKMRIELNRGWQRGANQFNTNALRQIRALGNVPNEPDAAAKDKKKRKKKKSKRAKVAAAAASADADADGEAGSGDDAMAVDESKKSVGQTSSSGGVTDCCICLFSVTVYQALFIAPCSHIFHFKCIRPLLLQHHPGFSCPLCRTFADLEADVEQDDIPEPVEEESSEGEEEEDDSEEEEEGVQVDAPAPALPDKDQPLATANANANAAATASTSAAPPQATENTAVHEEIAPAFTSHDANLDTLRPGRKSPHIPSTSAFSNAGAAAGAGPSAPSAGSSQQRLGATSSRSPSTRASLEGGRPASPGPSASGRRTPPSRGSRRGSSKHPPLSGPAVAAALEAHRTPSNAHNNHHHPDDNFSPPSAGDFDPDIRRSSIFVHGADGQGMQIPITGRSRPSSVYDVDVQSEHGGGSGSGPAVSPSAIAASHAGEKNKARSVKSLRMTQSRTSMGSLRNAAAAATSASNGGPSAVRRHPSAPSSSSSEDDEDSDDLDDLEPPLTARPMAAGQFGSEQYPFPEQLARHAATSGGASVSAIPIAGSHQAVPSPSLNGEAVAATSAQATNQDNTPPSDAPSPTSPQGKGKRKDDGPASPGRTTSPKQPPMPESSASFHAIV